MQSIGLEAFELAVAGRLCGVANGAAPPIEDGSGAVAAGYELYIQALQWKLSMARFDRYFPGGRPCRLPTSAAVL